MKTKTSKILNVVLLFVAVLTAYFAVGGFFDNKNFKTDTLLAETQLTAESFLTSNDEGVISLSDNVVLEDQLVIEQGTTLTIEGAGKTLTVSKGIQVGAGAVLNLNNITISGDITTSNQSEIYLNNAILKNITLYETAFMQVGGVSAVGVITVEPNLNPIFIESGATLNILTNGASVSSHPILVNFVSDFDVKDLTDRAIFFLEGLDEEGSEAFYKRVQLINAEKLMTTAKATTDGVAICVTLAEVGYKQASDANYIYTKLDYAIEKINTNAGNWEILIFRDLELSESYYKINSESSTLTITTPYTINDNDGTVIYEENQYCLSAISSAFYLNCETYINGNVLLKTDLGLNLTDATDWDNQATWPASKNYYINNSVVIEGYLFLTCNAYVELNDTAKVFGDVQFLFATLKLNGSSVLDCGSYDCGVFLGYNNDQLILNWNSPNGRIYSSTGNNAEAISFVDDYESSGNREVTPIVISSNLETKDFNGGKKIFIDGDEPNEPLKIVKLQNKSANPELLQMFELTQNGNLNSGNYKLRLNRNNLTDPYDDYLELTNEITFYIHYGESTDQIVPVTTAYSSNPIDLSSYEEKATSGFALVGYTNDGTSTSTKSELASNTITTEYLAQNNIFDIYAVYKVDYKIATYTKSDNLTTVDITSINYTYKATTGTQNIITSYMPSNPTNSGFNFSHWTKAAENFNNDNKIIFGDNTTLTFPAPAKGVSTLNAYAVWSKKFTFYGNPSGWGIEDDTFSKKTLTKQTVLYEYNTTGSQTVTVEFDESWEKPTQDGYKFVGWGALGEEKQTEKKLQWDLTLVSENNQFDVYAVWSAESIKINHYSQNTDLSTYTKTSTKEEKYVIVGTTFTASEKLNIPTGFKLNKFKYTGSGDLTNTSHTIQITQNGFEINYYYDYVEYQVSLSSGSEAYVNGSYPFTGYYNYEYTIATKDNYGEFVISADTTTINYDNGVYSFTMPANNVKITVKAVELKIDIDNESCTYKAKDTVITHGGVKATDGTTLTDTYDLSIASVTPTVESPYGFEISNSNLTVKSKTPTGVYTLTIKATGKNKGGVVTKEVVITVTPATITGVSEKTVEIVYDGSIYAIENMAPTGKAKDVSDNIITTPIPTITKNGSPVNAVNVKDVGTYEFTYTYTAQYHNNLLITTTLTIKPANLDLSGVVFENTTATYDGNGHKPTYKSGAKSTVAGFTGEITATCPDSEQTNAGTHTFTFTFTASNHNTATKQVTLTITPADLDLSGVVFENTSVTYDGNGHKPTYKSGAKSTVAGFTGEITATCTDAEQTNSGTYTFTFTFTASNHNTATKQVTLTITPADLDLSGVVFENTTATYDGNGHKPTYKSGAKSTVTNFTGKITATCTDAEQTNADTYTFTFTFTASNHNTATKQVTLTITPNTPEFSTNRINDTNYGTAWSIIKAEILGYVQNSINTSLKPDGTITAKLSNGTVLTDIYNSFSLGEHIIKVTFNPDDTTNYNKSVETDFVLPIIAPESGVNVTLDLTNTTANKANNFTHNSISVLTIIFTPVNGYSFYNIVVKINDTLQEVGVDYSYNNETGILTIEPDKIIGNVEITVVSTDTTKPTISEVKATAYNTLQFTATDGVGIVAYAVTTTASYTGATWNVVTETTNLTKSHEITSMAAGTYYVWVKDAAGNISESVSISAYAISVSNITESGIITEVYISNLNNLTENNNITSIVALSGTKVYAYLKTNEGLSAESYEFGWKESEDATEYLSSDKKYEITVEETNANYYAYAKLTNFKLSVNIFEQSTSLSEVLTEFTKVSTPINKSSITANSEKTIEEILQANEFVSFVSDTYGFEYYGYTYSGQEELQTNKTLNITINADNFIINIYFVRKSFEVSLITGVGTQNLTVTDENGSSYTASFTGYYGVKYTYTADIKTGYHTINYLVTDASDNIKNLGYPIVMPNYAIKIMSSATANILTLTIASEHTFTFSPTTSREISFNVANGSGDYRYTITETVGFTIEESKITIAAGTQANQDGYELTVTVQNSDGGGEPVQQNILVKILKATPTVNNLTFTGEYGKTWAQILNTAKAGKTNAKFEEQDVYGDWTFNDFKITDTEKVANVNDSYTYVIRWWPTDEDNYNAVNATISVTINQAITTVSLSGTQTYTYGLTWEKIIDGLTKNNSLSDTGENIYSYLLNGESLDLSQKPNASTTTYKLKAIYTPSATNNYNINYSSSQSAELEITVNRAEVEINITPTSIEKKYGNDSKKDYILSLITVDAINKNHPSINVLGSSSYTLEDGFDLPDQFNAGVHKLTVIFTLDDSEKQNYTVENITQEDAITLTINKATGDITFNYSGNINAETGNFILTYGDNKYVTVSGTVGDESFTVMHFGKNLIIEKPATLNTAAISFTNGETGAASITYLTANLSANKINVNCVYFDSPVKTIYVYAESANYTYVGSFEVELKRADYISNAKLQDNTLVFNGLAQTIEVEKVDASRDYFVKDLENKEVSYSLQILQSALGKDVTEDGAINVGKYTFIYTYLGGANYNSIILVKTLEITPAKLQAVSNVAWNKGILYWDATQSFVNPAKKPADEGYIVGNITGLEYQYVLTLNGKTSYILESGITQKDFTEIINKEAGTYTVSIVVESRSSGNCSNSDCVEASQYVTKLIGEKTQTGYTLTIGENTVTNAAGVYIINGESVSVSATMADGYTFTKFNSDNAAVTFASATSNSTKLTFTTTSEISEVKISIESKLKQYTVNITKGDGVTLEYKVSGAASFTTITTETSITLDALTTYVFNYSVSGGYKFTASLFGQTYTVASKDDITHTQNNETTQTINITTELIKYTVKVNVVGTGNAFISATETFAGLTELQLEGVQTAYLKAEVTSSDYSFDSFTATGYTDDYITITNPNSLNASFTTILKGHEDKTIIIDATFNLTGQRILKYQFYIKDTTGSSYELQEGCNLNKGSLVLGSSISGSDIYAAFIEKADKCFVKNGIVLDKITSSLSGTALLTTTDNNYETISGYETEIKAIADITLTDNLTISFYFIRLEKVVTLNYTGEDGVPAIATFNYYYGATLNLSDFTYNSEYTSTGAVVNFDYNTSYILDSENYSQAQTLTNKINDYKLHSESGTSMGLNPNITVDKEFTLFAIYTTERGSINITNKIRNGYDFLGWDTTSDLTDTEVVLSAETTSITPDNNNEITYYAKWSINELTITSTEFAAQTYTGSEIEFTATFSHSAGEFNKTGESVGYLWKFGESEKSSNQTLSLTNVNESGDYTISITLIDADGLTTTSSQDVTITINKADLGLTVKVQIKKEYHTNKNNTEIWPEGKTFAEYTASELLVSIAEGKIELFTSIEVPTLIYSGTNNTLVAENGIVWTKVNESSFENKLISGKNSYYYKITPKDSSNYNAQEGSFEITVEEVQIVKINAEYNQDGFIYSNESLSGLKNKSTLVLTGGSQTTKYWLNITLNKNDGTTESVNVGENLKNIKFSIDGSETFNLMNLSYSNGVATPIVQVVFTAESKNFDDYITVEITAIAPKELVVEKISDADADDGIGFKTTYLAFETLDTDKLIVKIKYNDGSIEINPLEFDTGYFVNYENNETGFRCGHKTATIVLSQDNSITYTIKELTVNKATLTALPDGKDSYSVVFGTTLQNIENGFITGLKFAEGIDKTLVLTVRDTAYEYPVVYNPDAINYNDFETKVKITITHAVLDVAVLGNENIPYDNNKHYSTATVNNYITPITLYYSETALTSENYNTLATGVFTLELTSGTTQNLTSIFVQNTGDTKTIYYYITNSNYSNVISGSVKIKITGDIAVTVEITYNGNVISELNKLSLKVGENAKNVVIKAYTTTGANVLNISSANITYTASLGGTGTASSEYVSASFTSFDSTLGNTLTLLGAKAYSENYFVKLNISLEGYAFKTSGYVIKINNIDKGDRTINWGSESETISFTGNEINPTTAFIYTPAWLTQEGTPTITYTYYQDEALTSEIDYIPTAKGKYYVMASVDATDYYIGATTTDSLIFNIVESEAVLTVHYKQVKTYIYNGQNQVITKGDLVVTANGEETNNYIISYLDFERNTITEIKNAGNYIIVVTLKEENYVETSEELSWTINKFTDANKVVLNHTTSALYYNGSEQELTGLNLTVDMVTDEVITNFNQSGITVTYTNNINAGTASVEISINTQNFEFRKSTTFTINRKTIIGDYIEFTYAKEGEEEEVVISFEDEIEWTGETHTIGARIKEGTLIEGDIVNLVLSNNSASEAGTYKVQITDITGENSNNYVLATTDLPTISFTITRYYYVYLDAVFNGGELVEGEESSIKIANNEALDLTLYNTNAQKDGYTFMGWAKTENATQALSSVIVNNSNITLYAIYKKDVTLTIIYLNNLQQAQEEVLMGTLFNKQTSVKINIEKVLAKAIINEPIGYSLTKIGEQGLMVLEINQNTVLKAYYSKDITLTKMLGTKEYDKEVKTLAYVINDKNELQALDTGVAFTLYKPLLKSTEGKFIGWATKNANDTYTLLDNQEILIIDKDTTIYALLEATINYSGFIKGLGIFLVILVILLIVFVVINKNRKKKSQAVAQIPQGMANTNDVDLDEFYNKSNRHHERIRDNRQKERDTKVLNEEYTPLIKNKVNAPSKEQQENMEKLNQAQSSNNSTNINEQNLQQQLANQNINTSIPTQNETTLQNDISDIDSILNKYKNLGDGSNNNSGNTN